MAYTVGDVAKLAHVSVRTLHHYDEIGLLKASERSESGYRLYADEDLTRLQDVLFYRELGFSLDEIRELVDDPAFDRTEALLAQRELVARRRAQLARLSELIEKTLVSLEGGVSMTKEEMFEVFGDFDPSEHEEEARQRWGDTDAYRESARRTRGYTAEDWRRFKASSEATENRLAELFTKGVSADDPRAMDAAEEARLLIDRWFYPCSHEMHANLAEMYVADPRFTAHYDDRHPGLAAWYREAIRANARRNGTTVM